MILSSFQQCGMCDQQSLKSACAYTQSDQSLCLTLDYYMTVKLLTEYYLEFLSLKGGRRGSSESTHKCHIVGNLMHCLILPMLSFTDAHEQIVYLLPIGTGTAP